MPARAVIGDGTHAAGKEAETGRLRRRPEDVGEERLREQERAEGVDREDALEGGLVEGGQGVVLGVEDACLGWDRAGQRGMSEWVFAPLVVHTKGIWGEDGMEGRGRAR